MPSSGDEEVRGGASGPPGERAPLPQYAPPPVDPALGPGAALERFSHLPKDRRDAWWWILFAALGFVIGQIAALIAIEVAGAVTGNGSRLTAIGNLAAPPAWYIGSGLVGLWVGFFVGPLLASRVRGTRHLAADVGLAFRWVDLFGVLIGFGGQLVVTVLYAPFISHLHNFSAPTTKLTGGAHGASFTVIAILTVLGAPFFEELFFRGLLFRGLLVLVARTGSRFRVGTAKTMAVGVAVLLDGLLFGLAHAEIEQLAGLAVFGCILAFVAFRTRRLGMNMVAHATFNLIAVIAIASNRSGVIH